MSKGRLRPGYDGIDAFLSHMWAVTLTGAPKKMAVQIIEDMETTPRRWYGAAVGGLLLNGDVNTGITIRTVHIEDGTAHYRVGATLLWDSEGMEEARETRTKATPFFRALAAPEVSVAPDGPAVARSVDGAVIVMIDNEDSFVHTLADYFRQRGAEVRTYRAGVPLARIVGRAAGNGRPLAGSGPSREVRDPRAGARAGRGRDRPVRRLSWATGDPSRRLAAGSRYWTRRATARRGASITPAIACSRECPTRPMSVPIIR